MVLWADVDVGVEVDLSVGEVLDGSSRDVDCVDGVCGNGDDVYKGGVD